MNFSKKIFLLILLLLIVGGIFFRFHNSILRRVDFAQAKYSTPPPSPRLIQVNDKTKIKYTQDYTIVLVGDSMTEALGNSDELRENLTKYYPGKTVEVLNYGFGSTNILSVLERLTKTVFYHRDFRPITDIDFNLILIESFGHNPLSEYNLEDGLKKQTDTLDVIVQTIKESNPNSKVAFVATIAPNKKNYAKGEVDLTEEKRLEWVNERIAYINNHLEYARTHNIPIIDIFNKSLNSSGDGKMDYISYKDYIHPSPTGIIFISQQLADEIYAQRLLNN